MPGQFSFVIMIASAGMLVLATRTGRARRPIRFGLLLAALTTGAALLLAFAQEFVLESAGLQALATAGPSTRAAFSANMSYRSPYVAQDSKETHGRSRAGCWAGRRPGIG
jgi:hypothetical protein